MTVTAAEHFTVVSQSGSSSYFTWDDTSRLVSSTLNSDDFSAANALWSDNPTASSSTKTLHLSVPDFIGDITDGAKFLSLKVTFQSRYDGVVNTLSEFGYLTGGTLFNMGSVSHGFGNYTTRALDGDAAYWGISGTSQEIFTDFKSGALKFNYRSNSGPYVNTTDHYIKNIRATLTYAQPDTKRASILITLP